MSHISRIQTHLSEQALLLKALQDLGCKVNLGDANLRAVGGLSSAKAELTTSLPGSGRKIGFVRSGAHYTIVADWWGIPANKRTEFMNKLAQRYAYHAAVEKLQAQGFSIAQEESAQNGQIHITLRRMA